MKHNNPKFFFNGEDGSSLCIIETKNKTYVGAAQCADADRDMMSEKTGCEIAYHRAIIRSLEDRKEELNAKLNGLKEYYYSMNTSQYFNPNGYEARRLQRHINMLKDDIGITKELIQDEKDFLKKYMNDKANFYARIRHNRKANSNK